MFWQVMVAQQMNRALNTQEANGAWPRLGEILGIERMKVNEVTQGGFYWYRDIEPSAEWELIDISIHQAPVGRNIYFVRAMLSVELADYEMPGVFIGPLAPPAER